MTSAPAAARSPAGRAALVLPRPLGSLAPLALALVVTVVLAAATPAVVSLAAAVLALALLTVAAMAVRATRSVLGLRTVPWWYLPAVLVVTVAVLVVRELTSGWSTGLRAADAVLLAAAPGALLVAAEAPLWSALRRGRAHGIVLRSTASLLSAAGITTLALDGLGTVVDGKVIDHVDPIEESHLRNLRWFAGALAHRSTATWGAAVAGLSMRGHVTEVVDEPDGVSGYVDRHPVRVGGLAWLGRPETPDTWDVLGVEVDGRSLGTITVVDKLADSVPGDVSALASDGVHPVLIAPQEPRAVALAERAGIELAAPGAVGSDGWAVVSADPATLGATDALLLGPESEEIRLDHADLTSAAQALRMCRAAHRSMRRAVVFALAWQAACIVLAAAGLLVLWTAAAAALVGVGIASVIATRV